MKNSHWLPFAAPQSTNTAVTACDVEAYFAITTKGENEASTSFRGRTLLGMKVEVDPDFRCKSHSESGDPENIEELWIWNHDDKPLRSDVVPQAVNLAKVQHALGSHSGIQ